MSQFRSLVFEGGGVKGIAYAGALEELDKRGITADVTRVAGTSAGAITAALVALGASAKYVADAVGGTNFRSFMDSSFGLVRDTSRLYLITVGSKAMRSLSGCANKFTLSLTIQILPLASYGSWQ